MEQCAQEKLNKNFDPSQEIIAVVGSPNSGKSSLFTHLTGAQARTVNYPGSTVDAMQGELRSRWGEPFRLLDTPGTYSLFPKTLEEEVTLRVLTTGFEKPISSVVIAVVDATQLARHLLVVKQLQEVGFLPVIALTMNDLLNREGLAMDISRLENLSGCPVVPVNGLNGKGVDMLAETVRRHLKSAPPSSTRLKLQPWSAQKLENIANQATLVAKQVISRSANHARWSPEKITLELDRWLLHPVWGLLVFVVAMALIFSSIFWAAAPAMDAIDGFFSGAAESILEWGLPALWGDLLANGIVASLGAVFVFLPQVALVFLFITLLESSGYLARAASLIDRPLSWIGLNGRSFVPILSGYACAIPAMLAARTIPSKRERFLTLFILPLMSCSARLPVYALLLAFLFQDAPAWQPGVALAALYIGSLVVGALVSGLLSRFYAEKEASFFMMELPLYRRPNWAATFKSVWLRTRAYVWNAGPVIFVFAVLIWAGTTFPNYQEEDPVTRLNTSYAAQAGQWIEPVMDPMGGDWRTGASLIAAFAAREVFVSSLAVTLSISETEDEESMQSAMLTSMSRATRADGSPLFTASSIVGLLLFFLIALQCMATFGVAKREFGGWKMAVIQLISFNLLAYGVAVIAVQSLKALGFS